MAVTTGKVRASFVHIFTPRVPDNGGDAKYSITLLIPKTDTATLNEIYADIERAKQEGAQKCFGGNVPPGIRIPIYDGDGYRPATGEPFGPECKGCMVLTASSKDMPFVVDTGMQTILNPADVYSGCYVRANINFFPYNNQSKGIGCGLNGVQKIEDGEPLTARVTAEEAFGGANAYAGMSQYGAQPAYQQQPAPQYQQPAYNAQPNMQGYSVPQGAPMGQPSYQPQPAYPQMQPQMQQGAYSAPAQQIDPITGRPIMNGGVLGV